MKRIIPIVLISIVSLCSHAYQPIASRPLKATFEGPLPEPYKTYKVEIELDKDTRDVTVLKIYRGLEEVEVPTEIISKLKQVNVNSVYVAHAMYRDKSDPSKPILLRGIVPCPDNLYIWLEYGEYQTVELTHKGEEYVMAGKDWIIIRVDNDNNINTDIVKFTELPRSWSKKIN